MKFLVLLAVFVPALAVPSRFQWESFKTKYNKVYENHDEEAYRFRVYQRNLRLITRYNERANRGEHSYVLGVNKFADLSFKEFSKTHLGYKNTDRTPAPEVHSYDDVSNAPESLDWREKNVVAPIKDQGTCGSCWAFSAVGSLESRNALANGKLVELSEQNLMDCSSRYGDQSCNGGLMDSAFAYILDNKGIDTEQAYPYKGVNEACMFNSSTVGATLKKYVDVQYGNEAALLNATVDGPVSVAMQATFALQFYSHGVLDDAFCGKPASLNHGVVVIGYGTEKGKDYWLVRNSWGENWGEQGYFKLIRNKNNCGIADLPSYPVV